MAVQDQQSPPTVAGACRSTSIDSLHVESSLHAILCCISNPYAYLEIVTQYQKSDIVKRYILTN